MPQQQLLAQARVGYPHRRDAPGVDLRIVVAGEELEVRAESLSEPCGAAQTGCSCSVYGSTTTRIVLDELGAATDF